MFFIDGTEIKFDQTQRYTYHHPTIIFTTHDEILSFFYALRELYCGRSDRYLNFMHELTERMNNLARSAEATS